MKAWEYSQISTGIVKGSSHYMENFNAMYGTSYVVPNWAMDANGNIFAQFIYLPDGIHPHSDRTGNCDKRLNAVYTKLLSHII